MPYKDKDKGRKHSKEYQRKPEVRIKRDSERRDNYDFTIDYKKDKFCVFCGYKEHPEILEFHHTGKKKDNVSRMVVRRRTLKVIKEEIKKCILLCPNCHRWHHFRGKKYSLSEKKDRVKRRLRVIGKAL